MFEIYLAGERNIVLCRADLIEKLNMPSTKSNFFSRFHITEGFVEYELYNVGIGSINDYETWKYNRQFFDQSMLTPNFNDQAVEWVNELCKEMESCWNNLGENHELNLSKWMHRFTNEIIFKVTTGVKNNNVNSYYNFIVECDNNTLKGIKGEPVDESEKFVKSVETYIGGLIYLTIFNNFMLHYVPIIRGKWKGFMKNKKYLFDKLHKVIKERKIEIENTPLDQPLRHDMMTSYITANTPRDINTVKRVGADILRPATDNEIRGMILDSMLGGTETVANLFCFIVYYLGRYPEVKQRVLRELDEVLGKDLTKPVTYRDLDELQYCEAFINEVNRHCPVSFWMTRLNAERDSIGGYDWPEATLFQMLYSSIMKHKNYWTDPEKFDPDRFYKVEESDKYLLEKQKAKNVFPMFGGGIRICPGKKLAMIELKCLMVYFRKYDIEMADINAPLKLKSDFINHVDECIVKVKPRKF
ncbi:12752_t:CDS:2 [Funneliformis caledonium]|uniref:12752_t:CDS:1 n=1 Tax=Funneliformis caledonium TaxID=1117310 RepID=A0A9N9GV87_9GLOM|nr:12752_t:CDS:2 [Funneliformis caledonium]